MAATPRQEVEVVITTMQADRAIGLARRVDANWSPRPSLHTTIEGEIAYQRRIPGEANAYLNSILRSLGAPAAPPRGIGDNGGPAMMQGRGRRGRRLIAFLCRMGASLDIVRKVRALKFELFRPIHSMPRCCN